MRCYTILLVFGWLLLLPPETPTARQELKMGGAYLDDNKILDLSAPISEWKIDRVFDSLEDGQPYTVDPGEGYASFETRETGCKPWRTHSIKSAADEFKDDVTRRIMPHLHQAAYLKYRKYTNSRCVQSDLVPK